MMFMMFMTGLKEGKTSTFVKLLAGLNKRVRSLYESKLQFPTVVCATSSDLGPGGDGDIDGCVANP